MTVEFRPTWIRWTGAVVGALTFFSFPVVETWSALMRVDMLALGLGYIGLVLMLISPRRPALAFVAMLAFVAAAYTKQTMIAGAVASLGVTLVATPRLALRAGAFAVTVGLFVLAVLEVATHGRFLSHVVTYNVNRFSVDIALQRIALELLLHPHYALLACAGVFASVRIYRDAHAGSSAPSSTQALIRQRLRILFIYSGLVSVMIVSCGKTGADLNYFIEWFSVWSILIGLFACWTLRLAWHGTREEPESPAGSLISTIVGVLFIAFLWRPAAQSVAMADAAGQRELAALVRRIAVAPAPVMTDVMVLLLRAGKEVPIEPAIFRELAATGTWDGDREAALFRRHCFAFLVTSGMPGFKMFDERYSPRTQAAMLAAYTPSEIIAGYRVWTPIDLPGGVTPGDEK